MEVAVHLHLPVPVVAQAAVEAAATANELAQQDKGLK